MQRQSRSRKKQGAYLPSLVHLYLAYQLYSRRATAYVADVSDWSSTYSVFERTWEKYGALHHVFAMAGAVEPKNVFDDTYDSEGRLEAPKYDVINSHVIGSFNTVKAALHYFRRQQNGEGTGALTDNRSITLCGSYYSYFTDTGVYQYCTSKHGIVGLMRGLSQYTPSIGVRTNMFAPWFVGECFADVAWMICDARLHL